MKTRKTSRAKRRSHSTRPRWASVAALIFVVAVTVASAALWPQPVQAGFTGGPSVKVFDYEPHPGMIARKVEIRWIADFVGFGKVEVFSNANGGTLIDSGATPAGTDHKMEFFVGGVIKADTTYFFKITHRDTVDVRGDLTNDPAPYPSFFTGAQTIGNVFVDAGVDRARILWDANVIGRGRVDYGIASPDEASIEDQQNTTSHTIEITGLLPGTTYHFRVSNLHAIDGGSLAAKTGSFTTQPSTPQVVQAIDDLRERVASYGLPRGIARSLDAKLEAALSAWQADNTDAACGALSDFLNEVRAQAGKKLSEAQAQQLTAAAADIRARIGC